MLRQSRMLRRSWQNRKEKTWKIPIRSASIEPSTGGRTTYFKELSFNNIPKIKSKSVLNHKKHFVKIKLIYNFG